jgi:hypothetical protein
MKAVKTIALGAVGLVALVGASAPAAAQYPGYGYPYGYNSPGNVVGQVINSVLNPYGQYGYGQYGGQYGYGQYGYGAMNPQLAAQQCTAAVQQRLGGGYGGYQGYGYNNAYGNGRMLGITRVEQRSNGTLRVRGEATSGMAYGGYPYGGYGGGYGGYGGYGGGYGGADLKFRCDVDYRGYIRDIDIDRRR